jgi:predicted Rossmann-fold nucleotide-binding protein
MEERRYVTLRERLGALIDGCQAAIALPGGVGTLTEIALFWNHLVIRAMEPKPLILVGAGWKTTFDVFFQQLGNYMNSHDRDLLSFAADVDTAVNHLSVYGRVQ